MNFERIAVKSSDCNLLFVPHSTIHISFFFFFLFSIGFAMANFGRFIFFIFAARLLKVVKYKSLPLNTSSSNEIRVKL